MKRTGIALLAAAIVAAACGSGDDGSDDSATTLSPVTTIAESAATSSSSADATTTTLDEVAVVTTDIDGADEPLAAAIAVAYQQALNPGQRDFMSIPTGLAEQFSTRPASTDDMMLSGTATTARVLDTDIAVFSSGDDVVLLANQPGRPEGASDGWDIVGAKLTSLGEPAWYGASPGLVLMLGSDARPGQKVTGFRADSVHILGAAPASGEGAIVGIPRDSWVATSYGGSAKLTNTMASRGPEVVLETVEMLTELDLEGYLLTGFQGFDELIDAFGGFTLDVPYGMADPKSDAYFSAGVQEIDGAEALAFSRNRTDTPRGDFGRQFNHGLVTLAVMAEVQERGIGVLPMLLEILTTYVITDLSAAQLLTLAASVYEMDLDQVTNIVASGSVGTTSGGASVVFLADSAFELFEDVADGVIDGEY